jgi:hypothetical protein
MARDDQLPWAMLDDVTKAAQSFLNPVLAGGMAAIWEPALGAWHGTRQLEPEA